MSNKRRSSRRQYDFRHTEAQDVVTAGPSDGLERVPDMTEREAEMIRNEASLLSRTAQAEINRTEDTKGRTRGYVIMIRRDDGQRFMVGSVQQWPEIRKSLASQSLYLP